ncbi:MAG: hypothetical protein M0031_11515 [Thermaerobacter sp.]|nr:hypothetical protein [Thermaerobacter sp.]
MRRVSNLSMVMSRDIFWGLTTAVLLFVAFAWYILRGQAEPLKSGERLILIFGGVGLLIFFTDAVLQLLMGKLI